MHVYRIILIVVNCCFMSEGVFENIIRKADLERSQHLIDGLRYLTQFGYINVSKTLTVVPNALQSSSELRKAIGIFQTSFQLPITKQFDDATLRLMTSPRCGNSDFPKHHNAPQIRKRYKRFAYDGKSRWGSKLLTYKIISYPSSKLTRSIVHSIFRKSFNIWSIVSDLDFHEEKDYTKGADIEISFGKRNHGDSIPFDGPGKVLAHAYFPSRYESGFSRSGDAHFDDDESWTDGTGDGKNLIAVAVHELGHSLGLSHSLVKTAVMFPFYIPPSSGLVSLDPDDITGIQHIYGAGDPDKIVPDVPELPDELWTPANIPTTSPIHISDETPDVCNTEIDNVVLIRGIQVYVFKGEWCWRVHASKLINDWHSYELRDPPFRFNHFWNIFVRIGIKSGIDCMFERDKDQLIYVFKNRRFWVLHDNENVARDFSENGKDISHLGFPTSLKNIDTMFAWGYNREIYVFAGDVYWKFNANEGLYGLVVRAPHYPRSIKWTWRGLPTPIDAAYTGLNGKTYFIKGKQYFAFNNDQMRVAYGFPKSSGIPWLGCTNANYREYLSRNVGLSNTANRYLLVIFYVLFLTSWIIN